MHPYPLFSAPVLSVEQLLGASLASMEVYYAERGEAGHCVDFKLVALNEAAAAARSVPEGQLVGLRLGQLFSTGNPVFLRQQFETALSTGHSSRFGLDNPWPGQSTTRPYTVVVTRVDDNTVLVCYDKMVEPTPQADLVRKIANNTNSLITRMEAIRGSDGQIEDFLYTMANNNSLAMMGLTESQVVGHRQSVLFPGAKSAGIFDQLVTVVDTGQVITQERYYAGGHHDAWLNTSYIKHNDGVCAISYDQTHSRQTQHEKQQQTDLFRSIISHIKEGVVLAEPILDETGQPIDFRMVFVNDIVARLLGVSTHQLLAKPVGKLLPGWQETDHFQSYLSVWRSEQPVQISFQQTIVDVKGWFELDISKIGPYVLCNYTNVTAAREAELNHRRQALLLEQVMNTTPTAIVVHESIRNEANEIIDFRMVKVNQLAADLMGKPVNQIEHRRISQYFPGFIDTPQFGQYCAVVETGETDRFEIQIGEGWYDFSAAKFGDGIVVAAQNNTVMRAYRRQLERANHELKRSNENLQSFTYVASHDLQEPLRKITSFTAILNDQYAGQLDPNVTDIIRRISGSAGRMRLLIQDLLAYSQVDAPTAKYKKINLTTLIKELADNELWAAIYQSKAVIHVGELPVLLADSFQMQQLFQNLLSNAIKFNRPGVAPLVTISTRLVSSDTIAELLPAAAQAQEGDATTSYYHEISIADNGVGFDEKYRDKIFQMFQRLHGRSRFPGSGVGLAICQKIVEKQGGVITVASQPGEGSTFRVYWPAYK